MTISAEIHTETQTEPFSEDLHTISRSQATSNPIKLASNNFQDQSSSSTTSPLSRYNDDLPTPTSYTSVN